MAAPVYYFFNGNFPIFELFSMWQYFRVIDKGSDESCFGPTEATDFQRDSMQPIYGAEVDNRVDRSKKEYNSPVLTSEQYDSDGRLYGHLLLHYHHK